jgi:hypothetical protein
MNQTKRLFVKKVNIIRILLHLKVESEVGKRQRFLEQVPDAFLPKNSKV